MIVQLLFFLTTILGVIAICFTKNVMHAAYAFALVLLSLAGLYILLGSELMGIVQILLYAGGVVILLAFGVMMTNRVQGGKLLSQSRNQIVAFILCASIFLFMINLVNSFNLETSKNLTEINQIEVIGVSFLTDHLVAFELIAFVLLVALVGASYLAKMSGND